jgi:tetratricopeptide (TPR) repeat protein
MINVNQITSRLASMPDQALQQYAAMHKNDPYVMALALSESNRRKQIRQGAQMQAPQQPKVVDQELAQMSQPMPEDTGIGQLPAPNMQNMAEGGIVAFEGGGEVPRMFNGGVPPRPVQRMPGDPITSEWDRMYGATYAPDGTPKASKQQYVLDPTSKSYVLNPQYVAPTKPTPAPAAPAAVASPAVLPPPPPDQDKSPLSALDKKPPPAPAAKPAAGLPALNTKPLSAEDAAKEAAKLGDDKNIRAEMEDYVERQKKIGEDAVGSFEKGIAGLPEAYKKYEARLQKEEADAATDKDKAMGMSIFKAGLAMMAGTSQNAFENIGKGAMAGLDEYQIALKDFKKAQRERDKAFADIEQARLADQRGDLKTKLELENRAADRNSAAEGKFVDGIASLFKTNKENARGIYQTGIEQTNQNLRSMYEQGEQTKRTIIQANAPTGLERIYNNPALFKKHIEAQTAATGMRGDTAIRESWAKSPYLQSQYPNVEDYVRMMAGSSGNAGGEFKVLGSRPSAP